MFRHLARQEIAILKTNAPLIASVARNWLFCSKTKEEEEKVEAGESSSAPVEVNDTKKDCCEHPETCEKEEECECGEEHEEEEEEGESCSCGHSHDEHEPGHIHESDPNDPVTALCEQINSDLELWQTEGTLNKDKLNEALDRFEEALKMTTTHMDALLGKAYVQGELGRTDAATQTLFKALQVDSKDVRVHNMLGEMGDFIDDALDIEMIEKFMDEKGVPTDAFKTALTEIFEKFAVEDGSGGRALTKASMNKFHDTVNGGPLAPASEAYIFSGEWEINKKGSLTLDGFIGFYLDQTVQDHQETISDLRKLGYDEECKPLKK